MSAPVDFTLNQLSALTDQLTTPLELVDRDNSRLFDSGIRERRGELQEANYVGATLASREPTPIGTEYDHQLDTVVGVRIEGLHHDEFGYVDPDENNGIPFDDLVDDVRRQLLAARRFPDAGRANVSFTDLTITNESPAMSDWADYFRYDLDVIYSGFETLPDV
jgi:hypothetical protein